MSIKVRAACKKRMTLGGTDAQALEGALTITEKERDALKAENDKLREALEEAIELIASASPLAWSFHNTGGEYGKLAALWEIKAKAFIDDIAIQALKEKE